MGRRQEDEIGRDLRRHRPSPTNEYVKSLARAVRPLPPSLHRGRRLAVAVAMSAFAALGLVFSGAMAQSVAAPKSVASIVTKAVTAPSAVTSQKAEASQSVVTSRKAATTQRAVTSQEAATSQKASTTQTTITRQKAVTGQKAVTTETVTTTETVLRTGLAAPLTVARLQDSPAIDQYGGGEGCTPGFWKNHPESFPSGVAAGDTLASEGFVGTGSITFDAALTEGGGGVDALLRHAAAAYLNALSISYPLTAGQVVSMTNDAIASGDATTIESLKDTFDGFNNLGAAGFCD